MSILQGKIVVDELAWDPSIYGQEWSFGAFRDQFGQNPRPSSMETHSLIHLSNATWNSSSSTSAQDLYSINLDSR